jgi:hypothetical protein
VELKKQIDELLEKGYIRSNTLPWAALVLFGEEGWYEEDVHRL